MLRPSRVRAFALRHRAWLLWFALLVLPLAQLGANAHLLAHAGTDIGIDAAGKKQAPHVASCELCLTAASVAAAAPPPDAPAVAPAALRDMRAPAFARRRRSGRLALGYRSRAPPLSPR